MIIQGRPTILDGPLTLNGLDRPPAEIAAELNTNWKNANPDLVALFKSGGISTDIFSATDQYVIDASNEEAKQELLAQQNADVEKEIEKLNQLNTKFENAKTVEEQKTVSAEIRNLTENTVQPKLIALTQNTIDYVDAHQGSMTDNQKDNLISTTANNATSVINYQNAVLDYTDAAITYASSPKTETDAAKLQTVVNNVNQTFDTYATDADRVQIAIADVEKSVQTVLASQQVNLTKKAVDTKAVTTNVTNKIVEPGFVFTEVAQQQSNVLPLIAAAAALYFGIGA
jgi:hypothetical protein